MSKGMGYLLPEGDAFTDELDCVLVFYPSKPEYRQALWGSLSYLATWIAWERDALKRGQDAARAWKIANDSTLECFSMAGCDIIENISTQVVNTLNQTILANSGVCCYLESQPPLEGNPAGGTPTTSEERDELCRQAQLAHDNGHSFLADVFGLATTGGTISAGLIAFLLTVYVVSLPLALLATFISIVLAIVAGTSTQTVLDDWDAIKHDVVCAIASATTSGGATNAVHNVIDGAAISSLSMSLFKAIYNQDQVNKIWNGEIGDASGYDEDYCNDCEPTEPLLCYGVSFEVISFSSSHSNQALAGIGWENKPSSSTVDNIILTAGDRHNLETPGAATIYDIVSPDYPIQQGTVIYEHGNPGGASVFKAGIGIWNKNASGLRTYNVQITNWKLLVKEIDSPNDPVWVAAELIGMEGEPTGFSIVGSSLVISGDYSGSSGGARHTAALEFEVD